MEKLPQGYDALLIYEFNKIKLVNPANFHAIQSHIHTYVNALLYLEHFHKPPISGLSSPEEINTYFWKVLFEEKQKVILLLSRTREEIEAERKAT